MDLLTMSTRELAGVASRTGALREWLEKARGIQSAGELLEQLGGRLKSAGVPIWRCATSIWPYHPEVASTSRPGSAAGASGSFGSIARRPRPR